MNSQKNNLKADGNIHIVPRSEEHEESENCWCRPEWCQENKKDYSSGEAYCKVLIHRRKKELLQ